MYGLKMVPFDNYPLFIISCS